MADPTQPQQENSLVEFFKRPENLATGLVFLAALAQPRNRGQSSLGAVGQAALGATAFRGGLQQGIRRETLQDEDRARAKLQQDKENEFKQTQIGIAQQGLGLEREKMSQAERLAREQNANALQLKGTATPETPEEAALKRAMTGYYERMPKETNKNSMFASIDPQMLQDMSKIQWQNEVNQAALEGRTPDPIRVTNSLFDFMRSVAAAGAVPGAHLVRNTDGSISIETAPLAPPAGAPGAPGAAPVERPMSPTMTPADIAPRAGGPGQFTPQQLAEQNQQREAGRFADQAGSFKDHKQVTEYIKKYGASLSKEQLKALADRRRELLRGQAATSSVMSGGGIR
jgi:hypothetical protein